MNDPRAAALYVCSKAHTVDDAAMLLGARGGWIVKRVWS